MSELTRIIKVAGLVVSLVVALYCTFMLITARFSDYWLMAVPLALIALRQYLD